MRHILIPYDFSEEAINALNYTKKLFKGLDICIYLLDVYIAEKPHLLSSEKSKDWFNEMDNEIEEESKYLVNILNKENENFKYQFIIKSNSLIKAIKEVVIDNKIDLIISGTKGAKSLKETFIGTNTMSIINSISTCPLLMVPTNYKHKLLHQIIFSTNYKRPFNNRELKLLLQLSILKDCPIEVINLSEEYTLSAKQKAHKIQLREIFKDLGVEYKKIDWDESETTTLENYITRTKSELLVLINHKHNFFNRLLEENVIKKSAFHSKIPMLILPEL